MKSIIKYYVIPVFLLIILNIVLILYVSRFQKNTYQQLSELDASNEYLSTVLETSVFLNSYLESRSTTDSLNFIRKTEELIVETGLFSTSTISGSELSDSLMFAVNDYALSLNELAEATYSAPGNLEIIRSNRVRTHILLQNIQQIVHQIDDGNSKTIINSLIHSNKLFYTLIFVYILVISSILLVSYTKIVQPLRRLRKEIQKLSTGSYTQIDIQRDDEIGDLIDSFNKTSESLIKSREELHRTNEKLQLTNKELETFAYSVSHDLRSPLRSISGFSEALVANYSDELTPRAKDYLGRVNQAAQKMGELIDDILNLSRVGRKVVDREIIDVSTLAEELIDFSTTDSEKNHFTFEVEKGISITADAGLTKIVMLNLISNAIKFSKNEPHPVIRIGSLKKDKRLWIFVKDNGIGFDMKYAEKIFRAFQRLHSDDEFKGSGIGLATVKRIVSKHGGDIFVESKQGKGTKITFNLGTDS